RHQLREVLFGHRAAVGAPRELRENLLGTRLVSQACRWAARKYPPAAYGIARRPFALGAPNRDCAYVRLAVRLAMVVIRSLRNDFQVVQLGGGLHQEGHRNGPHSSL